MFINTFNFVSNPHMTKKVPARTHRRKRINKKWLKRYGYKHIPLDSIYMVGTNVYGHPKTIEILKRKMR